MTTKLNGQITRELTIAGVDYTLVISESGVVLKRKRYRSGVEVRWEQLIVQHLEAKGFKPIAPVKPLIQNDANRSTHHPGCAFRANPALTCTCSVGR